jgi:hypothetical protein
MTNGTKVRITRGRHKGQTGTVAGTDLLGRLIIRTTSGLPVWVSPKSVKVA